MTKQCSHCRQELDASLFYKNKSNVKNGLDCYCKKCRLDIKNTLTAADKKIFGDRIPKLSDFHPLDKEWKRVDTWNKYDADKLDELLYNGGDITKVFYMNTTEKAESKKNSKNRKWGQKKDK
jgi:hypothetical protein